MTFFCEVKSQVPADMAGSEAWVLGSRTEPTAGGQASQRCLLPEHVLLRHIFLLLLLLSLNTGNYSCIFNIANSMPLVLLRGLFEVKTVKINKTKA